jgi:putative transposase
VVWAVDSQFGATTDGRPIKIVSIVDEHAVNTSAAWSSATSPDDT